MEGTRSQGARPEDPSLGVSAATGGGSWGLAGGGWPGEEARAASPSSVSSVSLLSVRQEWELEED